MSYNTEADINPQNLPRLPIPDLEQTLNKYLQTIKPLTSNKQEYDLHKQLVDDFYKNLAQKLQSRLLEHKKQQKYSWLEDWWYKYAYLIYEDPLLINSNWHCSIKDELFKKELLSKENSNNNSALIYPFSCYQLKRASKLIYHLLEFYELIENGEIKNHLPKNSKNTCLNQYKQMFGCCRIPNENGDYIKTQHPLKNNHVIVLVKDQFYKIEVYDYLNKRIADVEDIEQQLYSIIIEVVDERFESDKSVSILTAVNRKARNELIKHNKQNEINLKLIEDSIFCVCLDDYTTPDDENIRHLNYFHAYNGHNRWFDKTLNFVIDANGSAGLNGEHSPLDAIIPTLAFSYAAEKHHDVNNYNISFKKTETKRIRFKTNAHIQRVLIESQEQINQIILDSDSYIYQHTHYGSDFIKQIAKVSPDAYIQIAIQLAYYNIYHKCVATYETGSTTRFLHGRTDTVRTLSEQSLEFVKAAHESKKCSDLYIKLKQACDQHNKYTKEVMNGSGIDRHLLGLRLCMEKTESHSFFDSDLFKKSQAWTLSTSTIGYMPLVASAGFGTVDPNGYGINYRVFPDNLSFGIECKNSSKQSLGSKTFSKHLEWAFEKMKYICKNKNLNMNNNKL